MHGLYRKLPVVVEAVQYNGSTSVIVAIERWMKTGVYVSPLIQLRDIKSFYISTLEGEMEVSPGDYVIKGVHGEFYPCKPDIFKKTYESVS